MSWITKPLPHEVCSCGAELYLAAQSLAAAEQERKSFRAAHQVCRETSNRKELTMKKALITSKLVNRDGSVATLDLDDDQQVVGVERLGGWTLRIWIVQYNPIPEP